MDRMLFGAATVALAVLGLSAHSADHTKDTPAEVKKALMEGKAVLIDVREAEEWNDGHLKDAKHLALSEIQGGVTAERLKSLLPAAKNRVSALRGRSTFSEGVRVAQGGWLRNEAAEARLSRLAQGWVREGEVTGSGTDRAASRPVDRAVGRPFPLP